MSLSLSNNPTYFLVGWKPLKVLRDKQAAAWWAGAQGNVVADEEKNRGKTCSFHKKSELHFISAKTLELFGDTGGLVV